MFGLCERREALWKEHDTEGRLPPSSSSPPSLGRTDRQAYGKPCGTPSARVREEGGSVFGCRETTGPSFRRFVGQFGRRGGRGVAGSAGRAGSTRPLGKSPGLSGWGYPVSRPGVGFQKQSKSSKSGLSDLGFREPYFQRAQTQGDGLADEIILRAGPLD